MWRPINIHARKVAELTRSTRFALRLFLASIDLPSSVLRGDAGGEAAPAFIGVGVGLAGRRHLILDMILVEQIATAQAKAHLGSPKIDVLVEDQIKVHTGIFDDIGNASEATPRDPLVDPSDQQRELRVVRLHPELDVRDVLGRALELGAIKLEA